MLAAAACALAVLAIAGSASAGDLSYEWGEEAFNICSAMVAEAQSKTEEKLPRGICDTVQEVFEESMEVTGRGLAHSMGLSLSDDLAQRLAKSPFRQVGLGLIRDVTQHAIDERTNKEADITARLGQWFSAWMLKAAADDTNMPMDLMKMGGQQPPSLDPEMLKRVQESVAKQNQQQADEQDKDEL